MTYQEAVEKINSLLVFGSQPGLERIGEFVKRIGSPDKKLKFVHAAGTNGKGSTCALLAAVLAESGYKTGLFISPYVLEFRERFMINGEMIPPQILADITERLFPVIEEMKEEGKIITEFEFVLAIALTWYAEEGCDVVVLETGLGGRFDATNIIDTPLVSVITSISLDHTRILGDTYGKIAFEKCGIIKEGGTTVTYADQKAEAMEVIKNIAAERNNKFYIADTSNTEILNTDIKGTEFRFTRNGKNLDLFIRLIGEHQVKNACTALYALDVLCEKGLMIPDSAVKNGFAKVSFPARLEVLQKQPLVLLDGAHNPGGTAALAKALKKYLDGTRKVGIVGMLADKDVETALSVLLPLFDEIIAVAPDNDRKMPPETLAKIVKPYCAKVTPIHDPEEAYHTALTKTGENDALVIFGSLYLAADMRRIVVSD